MQYLHVEVFVSNNISKVTNDRTIFRNPQFVRFSGQAFKSCHNDTSISDVTLMCKNNRQIRAHKLILASASKLLNDLIANTKGPGRVFKIDLSLQNMEIVIKAYIIYHHFNDDILYRVEMHISGLIESYLLFCNYLIRKSIL